MVGALDGVKVLDLTRVLAGPLCTMILGDLGAEVIKVEAPGGSDETRKWGPPFQNGVSAYYLCANRNKKSLTVNLKDPRGKKIIYQLVEKSDVVIHNFKTGTMDRLGLGYEELSRCNPKLIYCSITGFGETGPYKNLPGYDFIIQGMSGLMSITGDEHTPPFKTGVAITDILTGLYACIGIQAALLEKDRSGRGQKIDLSLYDCAVSSLVNVASNYLMTKKVPPKMGNRHPNIVPYQTFRTADGEMVIAVGNDRQFQDLCSVLEMRELPSDPRFSTNPERVKHRTELIPILEKRFQMKSTAYWMEACQQKKIPCGPIQKLDEMVCDPQLTVREMFLSMEHPTAGTIQVVGSPLKLSKTPVKQNQYPPLPGEHNELILSHLGYSDAEIEDLKTNQII